MEFKNDMEYFEVKEGLKQYRYRIRCNQDRFSPRRAKPYELVFEGGRYLSGSYRSLTGVTGMSATIPTTIWRISLRMMRVKKIPCSMERGRWVRCISTDGIRTGSSTREDVSCIMKGRW